MLQTLFSDSPHCPDYSGFPVPNPSSSYRTASPNFPSLSATPFRSTVSLHTKNRPWKAQSTAVSWKSLKTYGDKRSWNHGDGGGGKLKPKETQRNSTPWAYNGCEVWIAYGAITKHAWNNEWGISGKQTWKKSILTSFRLEHPTVQGPVSGFQPSVLISPIQSTPAIKGEKNDAELPTLFTSATNAPV